MPKIRFADRARVVKEEPIEHCTDLARAPGVGLQYYTWRLKFSRIRLYKSDLASNFPMAGLDSTDCRILQSLQADASQSLAEIAKQVNLSPNACWHRIKHLEQDGIILKRVAILDPAKLGIGVTVFVRAGEHLDEWFENFAATVR